MLRELRFALRRLLRAPGLTAAAVICLALGIGANTAIFTVINAVLLRPLPFTEPARLVGVWEANSLRRSEVADIKHTGVNSATSPTVYWGLPRFPQTFMTLVVRTTGDPTLLANAVVERGALLVVVVGIAAGVAGAAALSRLLSALLYEVSATDPVTFVAIAALLLLVGTMAGYLPARRATQVDPIVAIRSE